MAMSPRLLRRILLRSQPHAVVLGAARRQPFLPTHELCSNYASSASETFTQEGKRGDENGGDRWFTLPPYAATVDGAVLGKEISRKRPPGSINDAVDGRGDAMSTCTASTTALKWVLRCCPELPRSLVQKLFRLRQVGCCFVFSCSNYINEKGACLPQIPSWGCSSLLAGSKRMLWHIGAFWYGHPATQTQT